MHCSAFNRSLYHFQADELPESERLAMQAHLDACPDCGARLEVEQGILRGLKARLAPLAAPPGLETRVRATLEAPRSGSRPGLAWIRAPWFAALAASALLALLLVPVAPGFDVTKVERVREEVVVVDRPCDLAGRSLDQQRVCRDPRHLNALKLADGSYWSVSMEGERGRRMLTDSTLRGHRLVVEGTLYPRIHTLHLDAAPHDLGAASSGNSGAH